MICKDTFMLKYIKLLLKYIVFRFLLVRILVLVYKVNMFKTRIF